jgi:hypothetical protein
MVNIVVHSPTINRIDLSGNGELFIENLVYANHLELSVSGSGNLIAPTLSVQSLKTSISGSGNIEIQEVICVNENATLSGSGNIAIHNGICVNQQLTISGSGNIDTEYVKSEHSNLTVSGSGNAVIHVTETLNVDISGHGDVKYRGKPVITSKITGTGKLIPIN